MKLPIFLSFTLVNIIFIHTHSAQISPTISPIPPPKTPSTTPSASPLDPKQLSALQSLNTPVPKNPCSNPASSHNATVCDNSTPFRHILSLSIVNCSDEVSVTNTALKSLSTLQDLRFVNCPIPAVRLPPALASNLRTFTCVNSLKRLTGVWLSRLVNVSDLTVSDVVVNASGPVIILGKLKKLNTVTIRNANLTGYLPKSWHHTITSIDLSSNQLKGHIPSSITELENLVSLDLSANKLNGELPSNIGDLILLRNLSVSRNSLSGSIPESVVSMPSLVHLDLSSNQFNGSIPKFLTSLKHLKYLNLEGNNFQGVMPFNESFIKKLAVFKIGENTNLCYNKTSFRAKIKLGISPCDKNGLPVSPPSSEDVSSGGGGDDYSDDGGGGSSDETTTKSGGHHGPNKVVLGVAIALSSIVFLIIFLVLLSRRCA